MDWQAIVGIIGIGLAWYFKSRADKSGVDNKLDKARSIDKIYKEEQDEVAAQIKQIADGIIKMKEKRAEKKPEQTDQERADDWNKE